VYTLYLHEPTTPSDPNFGVPQTAWTPTITINGFTPDGVNPVNQVVTDGAGPVIWSVVKTITNSTDRSTDVVTVTFSEPIGSNGNAFEKSKYSPSQFLVVWVRDSTTGTLVPDTVSLKGLTTNSYTGSNSVDSISFQMTNGKDLSLVNYISLISDSSAIISDKTNIPAIANNKKVPVRVNNISPVTPIIVAPNPAVANYKYVDIGHLDLVDIDVTNAQKWTKDGGAVLTFNIGVGTLKPQLNANGDTLRDSTGKVVLKSTDKVTGHLKIYDIIGNIVADVDSSNSSQGLISQSKMISKTATVYIYWNGSNSKKMTVAPGVYRSLLVLKITDTSTNKVSYNKLYGTIGIRR
jgi:hypothetical protein